VPAAVPTIAPSPVPAAIFLPTPVPAPIAAPELPRHGQTFSLPADLLFEQGKAELRLGADKALGKALATISVSYPGSYIMVAGHTDNVLWMPGATFKNNYEFSLARADSVRKFFVSKGISPSRLSIVGYGETMPVATNETDEGRTANRRMELVIYGAKEGGINDLIVKSKLLAEQGKLQAALVRLLKAAELDPYSAETYSLMGYCYYKLGQRETAHRAYKRSLQLNPNDEKLKKFLEGWR
jgi:outer membrane protein OmpA-like peptidoglycan-associated protein